MGLQQAKFDCMDYVFDLTFLTYVNLIKYKCVSNTDEGMKIKCLYNFS